MSGTVTCKLPSGKCGLVFIGADDAVLQRVVPDGPMAGANIKPGYIVEAFVAANGVETPTPSKKQLVELLDETKEHTGRKLKLKIAFKKEQEVELDASEELGFEIKDMGGVPIIGRIEPDCALKKIISRGMVIDNVTTDDFSMTGQSATNINALLEKTSSQTGRKLTLKPPKSSLSPQACDYEEQVFALPVGEELGITWGGTTATITSVDTSSALFGQAFPGMKCGAIRIPDGRQIEFSSGNTLSTIIQETINEEGRLLLFPATESIGEQEPLLKYYVSALGMNTSELGCKVTEGDGKLVLAEALAEGVPAGLEFVSFNWLTGGGEKSEEVTSEEELNSFLDESSGCQRFFVLKGLDSKYMPDEITTIIPKGPLGATLKGSSVCTLMKIKATSPLMQTAVTPGMTVASLSVDGKTILTNPSTSEVIKALGENADSDTRTIKFINPSMY